MGEAAACGRGATPNPAHRALYLARILVMSRLSVSGLSSDASIVRGSTALGALDGLQRGYTLVSALVLSARRPTRLCGKDMLAFVSLSADN